MRVGVGWIRGSRRWRRVGGDGADGLATAPSGRRRRLQQRRQRVQERSPPPRRWPKRWFGGRRGQNRLGRRLFLSGCGRRRLAVGDRSLIVRRRRGFALSGRLAGGWDCEKVRSLHFSGTKAHGSQNRGELVSRAPRERGHLPADDESFRDSMVWTARASPPIAARIIPARRSTTSTRTTRSPHTR